MQRTVVLVKPDGVVRGLIGEVVGRFERVGFKIVGMKMVWVDKEMIKKHYPMTRTEWVKKVGQKTLEAYEKYGKDTGEELGTKDPKVIGEQVCKWLVDYMTSGPVVAMLIEGNRVIEAVRKMAGYTYPDQAVPGTIRGDFSADSPDLANMMKRPAKNIVHASGNEEEAKFEEELWFRKEEIHAYKRADEDAIFG